MRPAGVPKGGGRLMTKSASRSRMGFLAPAISVMLSAAAAIAGAAYFFGVAPVDAPWSALFHASKSDPASDQGKVAAAPSGKKDEAKGKGRGGAAPVTAATVVEVDMPVI